LKKSSKFAKIFRHAIVYSTASRFFGVGGRPTHPTPAEQTMNELCQK